MKNNHFKKHFKKMAVLLLSLSLINMTGIVALADETEPTETTAAESSEKLSEEEMAKIKEEWVEEVSQRTGEGYLSIQGYVEEEIRNQGYTCYVQVINNITYETYDIYLYTTNNYAATTTLPAGAYTITHKTVVNDTTSKYPGKVKDNPTVWIIEGVKAYDFDMFDGGVVTLDISFGDATFDNIVSETEAVRGPIIEIETEEPETEAIEETTEAITETTAAATTETEASETGETQAKSGSPVKVIISAVFLIAVVAAYAWIKIKNKKGQR
jgi:hypothetical protein